MKITPVKTGIVVIRSGKNATRYNLQAGVETEIPAELKKPLVEKGYIAKQTKKTKIIKENKDEL